MSSDLDKFVGELQEKVLNEARKHYSEQVIEHWLHPRNPGPMENPDGHARLIGECGDTMEIFLRVRRDVILEARFMTDGCATSIACGSVAVELATDKPVKEARTVTDKDILEELGGLPEENEHCATLASRTLWEAIKDYTLSKNEGWKKLYRR